MFSIFNTAVTAKASSTAREAAKLPLERPTFEAVYNKEFAFTWRTMRALGVHPGYVDDAVQDVFIVVHRRLVDYKPEASLRSWVFGIVRRVARDYRRSDKRKGQHLPMNENTGGANYSDPYKDATRNQALKAVEEFADTLDEERRAIFVLSLLEEMPVTEIASVMELNLNTVYSRLKVIKERLSKFVQGRFGEEQGGYYE